MQKRLLSCFIILFYVVFLLPAFADAREPNIGNRDIFLFPAYLEEIGEDAFAGTAVRILVLREKLAHIGNGAFSDTAFLTDIFIPPSVEYIGELAFPENKAYVVHGRMGSFAHRWAEEHQVCFVESNIWDMILPKGENVSPAEYPFKRNMHDINSDLLIRYSGGGVNKHRSMRPQDRPELYPIDYRFP